MLLPKKALPLLLLCILLLGGCTSSKMLAPMTVQPTEAHVKLENPPTYAAATLGPKPANRLHQASPSGLALRRGDKVLVIKRMDPNWYVISQQGQEYFIAYEYLSLSPRRPTGR